MPDIPTHYQQPTIFKPRPAIVRLQANIYTGKEASLPVTTSAVIIVTSMAVYKCYQAQNHYMSGTPLLNYTLNKSAITEQPDS